MTEEEKQLLFNDLCARLPYGVKVYSNGIPHEQTLIGFVPDIEHYNIKPYLRPLSSMTGVEVLEYISLKESIVASDGITYSFETYKSIDWLNSHHFDYRNLIENGLALEAPEGMYKTK